MQRIRLHSNGSPGNEFCRPPHQHLVGEVRGQHRPAILWPPPQQSHRHIPGAAAQIQNLCVTPGEHLAKRTCRPPPPNPVNIAGEDMVQQIVAWGDLVEHGAHGCGCAGLIPGPVGLSSSRHDYLPLSEGRRM